MRPLAAAARRHCGVLEHRPRRQLRTAVEDGRPGHSAPPGHREEGRTAGPSRGFLHIYHYNRCHSSVFLTLLYNSFYIFTIFAYVTSWRTVSKNIRNVLPTPPHPSPAPLFPLRQLDRTALLAGSFVRFIFHLRAPKQGGPVRWLPAQPPPQSASTLRRRSAVGRPRGRRPNAPRTLRCGRPRGRRPRPCAYSNAGSPCGRRPSPRARSDALLAARARVAAASPAAEAATAAADHGRRYSWTELHAATHAAGRASAHAPVSCQSYDW